MHKTFFGRIKTLAPFMCSVVLMAIVFSITPHLSWHRALHVISQLGWTFCFYVAGIILFNTCLSAWRLKYIARFWGMHLSFSGAFRAVNAGAIGGLCAPLVGGLLGQRWVLCQGSESFSAHAYLLEKGISTVIGATLAIGSAFYLWSDSLSLFFNWGFYSKTIAMAFMIFFSYFFILHPEERKEIQIKRQDLKLLTALSAASLISWISISSMFFIGTWYLAPKIFWIKGASAALLVSFFSSLPISISGWSTREFFSVEILPQAGITPDAALWLALCIGFISLLSVLAIATQSRWYKKIVFPAMAENSLFQEREKLFVRWLGYGVSLFLFFYYTLQFQDISVNVCFADIFSLCGLFIAGPLILKEGLKWKFISIQNFFIGSSFIVLYSFFIGMTRWGFLPWAFGKVIGWVVILGYMALGSLFVRQEGLRGLKRCVEIMSGVIGAITLYNMVQQWFLFTLRKFHLYHNSMVGFVDNRNAFVMQLICIIILAHCLLDHKQSKMRWNMGLLLAGVCFTWSRSGHFIMGGLIIAGVLSGRLHWRLLCQYAWRATLIIAGYFGSHLLSVLDWSIFIAKTTSAYQDPLKKMMYFVVYSSENSDHERWKTCREAYKLWSTYPIWGAGLGAFVIQEIKYYGKFLIIHNTPLWLAAEGGIIAVCLGGTFLYKLLRQLWHKHIRIIPTNQALLAIICTMGIFSLAHEVLYQRIFFWCFGLLLAQRSTTKSTLTHHS